jgi:hypothetical protein
MKEYSVLNSYFIMLATSVCPMRYFATQSRLFQFYFNQYNRNMIPGRDRDLSLSLVSGLALRTTQPLIQWVQGLALRSEQMRHDASPLTSVYYKD